MALLVHGVGNDRQLSYVKAAVFERPDRVLSVRKVQVDRDRSVALLLEERGGIAVLGRHGGTTLPLGA